MAKKKALLTIGISDSIDIPTASLQNIACKIDTGAYNCSIHCSSYKMSENKEGISILTFTLLGKNYKEYKGVKITTTDFSRKKVKSSNGVVQYRYQVSIPIILMGEKYVTVFNLSKRQNMRYPILLGRKFLSNKFLVDVSKRKKSKPKGKITSTKKKKIQIKDTSSSKAK
ncbi:RimK/LysX family protein [Bacteroidia bacterium]|nr:RimK/LysX family protein [Bacteroidia bacterium]MDB9881975.1 RimK/LysX family protein [Bacteroidia bacterium]